MDELLHQLGGLLLGSVPTICIFLLIVVSYRLLVYGPLTRVLRERYARTEGTLEEAHAAIAAAEAKSQEYDAKVRAARAAIFHARELRLQQWNSERDKAVAEAREIAQRRVAEAKNATAQQVEEAKRRIESSADELAAEVLRVILPADLALSGSSR
jgi:F-type H+-transporting ATPase subunit b